MNKQVNVVKNVLQANDIIAEKNRQVFKDNQILAINIISSPGSGKTTLLEKTIPALKPEQKSIVLVGDLATTRDADRVAPYAEAATQINTGMSCHLYANQIEESLKDLPLENSDYIFIENVGNMVCPGEFDLGENVKVTLMSIPEGDDKVAKYPTIFRAADVVLFTKIDLIEVLDFDMERVLDDLRKLNANVPIINISSKTGEGMEEWISWLKDQRQKSIGSMAKTIKE